MTRQRRRNFSAKKGVSAKRKGRANKKSSRSIKGVHSIHLDTVLDQLEDDRAELEYRYRDFRILTYSEAELLKRVSPHAVGKILRPKRVEKVRTIKRKISRKVTQTNREQLALFLYNCIARLHHLALADPETPAKIWAGKTLGCVFGWLKKHDKKLSSVNAYYGEAKSKIRKELKSPSLIRQIVLEELQKADRVWSRLQMNPTLEIPDEYRPLLKLPSFPEAEEAWFKEILWPEIKKRKEELLPKLRAASPHRVKSLKDCYSQFRDVSQSIARAVLRIPLRVTIAGTL